MAASNGGSLPVVDLASFFSKEEGGAAARASATEAVRNACLATGLFRVVSHGVPPELMARSLELSSAFFALPEEEKDKVRPAEGSFTGAPLPDGYARQPAHSVDKNEYLFVFSPKLWHNLYPTEPAGFRFPCDVIKYCMHVINKELTTRQNILKEALEECFAKLTELGLLIHEILNDSMGLPRGFLAEYNSDRSFDLISAVRYFPATSAEETNGTTAHKDANCVTFVLQDGVGGLEVLGEDGGWFPAEPVEGSIVVNVGDVVKVLSNGRFQSSTHRVVRKPAMHRHSLVFFFSIHSDKWVEPLPEFAGDVGEPPRYRGFRYGEYLQRRMRNKTHPPSRPEDVVDITHYAI